MGKLRFRAMACALGGAVVLSTAALLSGVMAQTTQAMLDSGMADRSAATLEEQVSFLRQCGWEIEEDSWVQDVVRIPDPFPPAYEQYNLLQQSQGMDLSPYCGQEVLRCRYQAKDQEDVWITLLIREDRIVGADVTDLRMQGGVSSIFSQGGKVLQ